MNNSIGPIYEICKNAILEPTEFSKEANDYLIKILEDNNDYYTASLALIYNSRYVQLNKTQRLKLLKLALSNENIIVIDNYKYLSKARKYEINYIIDNVSIDILAISISNFPKSYIKTIIEKNEKNEKLMSILTFLKITD